VLLIKVKAACILAEVAAERAHLPDMIAGKEHALSHRSIFQIRYRRLLFQIAFKHFLFDI
jgi:hypothetical protein